MNVTLSPTDRAAAMLGREPATMIRAMAHSIAARIEAGHFRRLPQCERTLLRADAMQLDRIADQLDADAEAARAPSERELVRRGWVSRVFRRAWR